MQVYLHIYKHLQYKHYITASQVHDIEMTSDGLCDVIMSHRHHVPAGWDQDRCVKSFLTLKMKSTVLSKVYF